MQRFSLCLCKVLVLCKKSVNENEKNSAKNLQTAIAQVENFRIWRTEHFIDLEIDKWVIVRFHFDENDVVYRIRISGMG